MENLNNKKRVYFDPNTLDDALLKSYVATNENLIKEANEYVEAVALGLGVQSQYIYEPTPLLVRNLGVYYVYMTCAQRKSLFAKGGDADNDSFALKFKLYKGLLDSLLNMLTANTFTNGVQARKRCFPASLSMSRN